MNRGTTGIAGTTAVIIVVAMIAMVQTACSLNNAGNSTPGGGPPDNSAATGNAGTQQSGSAAVIGQRTKSSGCAIHGALQDRDCTPGAVFASATKDQICRLGYAKSVRNVPVSEKDQVYAAYGIRSHQPGQYEVDHLVSLEIGGSNDIANLWPEAAEPKPGFHEKDRFENYLHDQVCSGKISLQQAQREIADDWLTYWQQAGQP